MKLNAQIIPDFSGMTLEIQIALGVIFSFQCYHVTLAMII